MGSASRVRGTAGDVGVAALGSGVVWGTRDLAVYAAVIATLHGAWSLFHGVVRDRARVVVKVSEAQIHPTGTRILDVTVSNRGRRPVYIVKVAPVVSAARGGHLILVDFMSQLTPPPRLAEGESTSFHHGLHGGHTPGDLRMNRWFVRDGAGRIHPLHERYRQRIERFVFWPIRRRDRRKRDGGTDS
jgi:hypothetical protein